MILLRVYGQQITVAKEFRRHLAMLKEEETRAEWLATEQARQRRRRERNKSDDSTNSASDTAMIEFAMIRKPDRLLSWHLDTSMSPFSDDDPAKTGLGAAAAAAGSSAVPIQEADVVHELIESRQFELQELEEAASRTCTQVWWDRSLTHLNG